MNFFNLFKSATPKLQTQTSAESILGYGYGYPLFNGEKNLQTLGLPYLYDLDYYAMANRAWNLYLTTDITKICIDRLVQFAIGDGLKLQYEPDRVYLARQYNIQIETELIKYIESCWRLYANTKDYVSSNQQQDIHNLATTIMVNTLLCGDCLVVKQINKQGYASYQVIDGRNVCGGMPQNSNNSIIDGVELDKYGRHVAYHINTLSGSTRITAQDSQGNAQAWLVYANNSRISQVRGVSSICSIIQKLDQLSKYVENEVTASKVNSQFAAVIEHGELSDGRSPLLGRGLARPNPATNASDTSVADKQAIAKLTNGLVAELGVGKTLKTFDTKRPNLNFEAFLNANAKYIFASQSIPFEIAIMLFSNNFSASRAALKMFELTLKVMRKNILIDGLYKPAFQNFFLLESLKGNFSMDRFSDIRQDPLGLPALTKCRFISPPIPHVDPKKEVDAIVTKINNHLSTVEEGMEDLGSSADFDGTMDKILEEQKTLKQLHQNNPTNNQRK